MGNVYFQEQQYRDNTPWESNDKERSFVHIGSLSFRITARALNSGKGVWRSRNSCLLRRPYDRVGLANAQRRAKGNSASVQVGQKYQWIKASWQTSQTLEQASYLKQARGCERSSSMLYLGRLAFGPWKPSTTNHY